MREYVYETLMARSFDEPFSLYGLIAESIDTPAGPQLGHLPNPPASPLCGRHANYAGRRAVLLVAAQGQGAPQSPQLLCEGCQRRKARRARRQVHLHGRRPGNAAHHGADAGPAAARGQSGDFRAHEFRKAGCKRPLRCRGGFAGRQHRVQAQPGLLGPRFAHRAGPVQFRHHPHRILSRQHRHDGGFQKGLVRGHRRQRDDRRGPMGRGIRFSGGARRPG